MPINEANWLRKLLLRSVLGTSDSPEGQASFSLAMLMATTLAGKVFEGWDRIRSGWLRDALQDVELPAELNALRDRFETLLSKETFAGIRNNIVFHYHNKRLDFKNLAQQIEDSDAILFMVPEEYDGDVLSLLSTLAGLEQVLAMKKGQNYRTALEAVWNEVMETTHLYCQFVNKIMFFIVRQSVQSVREEYVTIEDAPEADQTSIRFFVHPPPDLEAMRAEVAAKAII